MTVEEASLLEPILASSGSIQMPLDLSLRTFVRNNGPPIRSNAGKGNNGFVWASADRDQTELVERDLGSNECSYFLALHSKRRKATAFYELPLSRVKPRRTYNVKDDEKGDSPSLAREQKAALGSMFGSKRAQRSLRTIERNKMDVDSTDLQSAQSGLQSSLGSGFEDVALPSAAEISDAIRSMPPPNQAANTPSDVYPIDVLVPSDRLSLVDVKHVSDQISHSDRLAALAFGKSQFLDNSLRLAYAQFGSHAKRTAQLSKIGRTKVQLILYLDWLLAFREERPPKSLTRMRKTWAFHIPEAVLTGIHQDFTESVGGFAADTDKGRMMTSFSEAKLLGRILALTLSIADFEADINMVANDLQLPQKKVRDIYKALGCTIVKNNNSPEIASLKLPLVFPKARKEFRCIAASGSPNSLVIILASPDLPSLLGLRKLSPPSVPALQRLCLRRDMEGGTHPQAQDQPACQLFVASSRASEDYAMADIVKSNSESLAMPKLGDNAFSEAAEAKSNERHSDEHLGQAIGLDAGAKIKVDLDRGNGRTMRSRVKSPKKALHSKADTAVLPSQNAVKKEPRDDESFSRSPTTPLREKKHSIGTVEGAVAPLLISHLPIAEEEAMKTFQELDSSIYQNRNLGRPRQQEDSFQCECRYDPDHDDPTEACGEGSNCINRLTQVECPEDDCHCFAHCQNQRLAKKQYSTFDIVKTDKKGFGVRASSKLEADQLVIEYIGEVIGHNNFVRRIREYSDEGIKHFYFMALQKDEFIDATRKGGRGRFLNHSCNPNCYVAKWVVGKRLRMGIFAKREIQKDEELTFNYNVDRYGHEAQECYCGEANCIGYIGGKTQTDIGIMDDLFLDALGIADEVEERGLKGSKKKKGKRLDEDFVPIMRPITLEEAPKVISALRQAANNKRILVKLLERVRLTTEMTVQNQLMRLRGFSLMAMLLEEHASDIAGIVSSILHILASWPLLTRNKLSTTSLESVVKTIAEECQLTEVQEQAAKLTLKWSELELAYRIPRAQQDALQTDKSSKRVLETISENLYGYKKQRLDFLEDLASSFVNPIFVKPEATVSAPAVKADPSALPEGWEQAKRDDGAVYFYHIASRTTRWTMPSRMECDEIEAKSRNSARHAVDLSSIIEQAKAAMNAKLVEPDAVNTVPLSDAGTSEADAPPLPAIRKKRKKGSPPKDKDKQILGLFSPIVVQIMTKYAKRHLERDIFKKRAKELTQLLVEKERKSSSYDSDPYTVLSAEKEKKIRSFAKEWIAKLLKRTRSDSTSRNQAKTDSMESQIRTLEEESAPAIDTMFSDPNYQSDHHDQLVRS